MKVDPTMLLKTNKERVAFLTDPTISMKIKGLTYDSHDMYENKDAWPNRRSKREMERVRPRPALVLSLDRLRPPVGVQVGATRPLHRFWSRNRQ